MLQTIKNLIRKILLPDSTMKEYFDRFVIPSVEYAKSQGLSDETIDRLVKEAISESDGVTSLPGGLLRAKIDSELESRS